MSENKYHIESLTRATDMFKSLQGKEVTSKEFRETCREFKVRDGLLQYAYERKFCKMDRPNKYYFHRHLHQYTY